MLNGTSLTLRPIVGTGIGEGGRIMGVETGVNNERAKAGGFAESHGEV